MASRMDERELELVLADLGGRLAYPRADLWPAVRERIAARRRPWWTRVLSPRALVPVAATLLVILAAVLVVSPEARAKAAEILGLRGVQIFQVPETPSPTPTRSPGATVTPPPGAFPGTRVTLAEARAGAGFALRLPVAFGEPDEVYLQTADNGNRVTLLYRSVPGIPPSPQMGVSAAVVEVAGSVDANIFAKFAGPGTKVEPLTVNGGQGVWLEGEPHQIVYRDTRGNFIPDTLRLAGNTLLWEQGGVTLRIEAQVSKDEALRIAGSFR